MKLNQFYFKNAVPTLKKELKEENILALPRLTKIVVNVGIGSMFTKQQMKDFTNIETSIANITGQKPVVIKAKKSVSNFKLRENTPNGIKVTLRGERMYDFFSKLVNIVLPRVRDFRGVSVKGFDQNGNYSLGLKESMMFPEIKIDDEYKPFGLQITIGVKNSTPKNSELLFRILGFPFKEKVTN